MKWRVPTPVLVFTAVFGGFSLLIALTGAQPDAAVDGAEYVAGVWTGRLVFIGLGIWASWALAKRSREAKPKTFSPGGDSAPTFTTGNQTPPSNQPMPGGPSFVRPGQEQAPQPPADER